MKRRFAGAHGSLWRRLLVWLVSLHLLAAGIAIAISYLNFGHTLDSFNDEKIRRLAEAYMETESLPSQLRQLDARSVFERGAPVVQFWSSDGRLLASSWAVLPLPLQTEPGLHDVRTGETRRDTWRVYTTAVSAEGPAIQVALNSSFLRRVVRQRAIGAALPVALMLPVTLALLLFVVWTTSRSLRQFAREVAAQDERAPSGLLAARVPEEIAPLVDAFNDLVARLQRAFSAQQRFAQDAAHELRSPVTAIGLQLENLRPYVSDGEGIARFQRLEAGVARTKHLIEQLLRLSTELKDHNAQPEVLDVAALLRESIAQQLPQADRRHIDLGLDGEGTAVLHAPAVEVRSLFDNLIDNAVRYTQEGGVVDIRLRRAGPATLVEVVDNGPGMSAASRARAFDRFFRAPGSPAGGSGLGLAIAFGVAERHGLRIELLDRGDEEPGRTGLIARVHLPPEPSGTAVRSMLTKR